MFRGGREGRESRKGQGTEEEELRSVEGRRNGGERDNEAGGNEEGVEEWKRGRDKWAWRGFETRQEKDE